MAIDAPFGSKSPFKRSAVHVLIADDHRLVIDTLSEYLKNHFSDIRVSECINLQQVLERITQAEDLDLVILDLDMPGMNGLEGLSQIRERLPDTPVAMISGVANQSQISNAFAKGASGFITKEMSASAMVKALELILAGEIYVPSTMLSRLCTPAKLSADRVRPQSNSDNPFDHLTRREAEVLTLLLRGHSNKDITKELDIKEITTAFHLRGLYKKLGVSNRTQAAMMALRHGWTED